MARIGTSLPRAKRSRAIGLNLNESCQGIFRGRSHGTRTPLEDNQVTEQGIPGLFDSGLAALPRATYLASTLTYAHRTVPREHPALRRMTS